jgi:hypothetical protein
MQSDSLRHFLHSANCSSVKWQGFSNKQALQHSWTIAWTRLTLHQYPVLLNLPLWVEVEVTLQPRSVGQFVLVSCPFWSKWPDITFIWATVIFFIFHVGSPLWREDGSVIWSAMMQLQFQVTLRPTVCRPVSLGAGPSMGLITTF